MKPTGTVRLDWVDLDTGEEPLRLALRDAAGNASVLDGEKARRAVEANRLPKGEERNRALADLFRQGELVQTDW